MEIKKISGLFDPDSSIEFVIIQKINEMIDSINFASSDILKMSEDIKNLKYSIQEIEKSFHSDSHY